MGRQIALIFEKTSTRTRVSFEVAIRDQGGHVTVLDPASSQIGHKESTADTARVLSRMFDAIEYRGASQELVEELAAYADVPVYNGLTDEWHPTQMLADFLTMREHAADPTAPISLRLPRRRPQQHGQLAARHGRDHGRRRPHRRARRPVASGRRARDRIAMPPPAPVRASPSPRIRTRASPAPSSCTPTCGCRWASRGGVGRARRPAAPYRVDADLMARAGHAGAKFMHCLPAYHDQKTAIGRSIAADFGLPTGSRSRTRCSSPRPASCSTRQRTACTRSRRSWSPLSPSGQESNLPAQGLGHSCRSPAQIR